MVVSAEYRGLTVKEMQALRKKLREGGLDVKVVKNTLLKLAAEQAGQRGRHADRRRADGAGHLLRRHHRGREGHDGLRADRPAGVQAPRRLPGRHVLTATDLKDLTKIPPKPSCSRSSWARCSRPLQNFIGLLDAPLQELTQLFQSLLSELPGLVEARAKQLEAA